MKKIVTAQEIKEIEQYAIGEIGVPSLVLMERAALCVSERIRQRFSKKETICIVCGVGNNGADGVAIARQLLESEFQVTVVVPGQPEKFTEELKYQISILESCGLQFLKEIPNKDFSCFVDAILGVGLSRSITDKFILKAIETINSSDAYIYSVDIPSGICTDTGRIMGEAVKANETITFSYGKTGLYVFPGKQYAGKVTVEEIGLKLFEKSGRKMSHYMLEDIDVHRLLQRKPDGNKGTFGKVAVIAGSDEISGACILCAKAVLRSGAGMVKVLSSKENAEVLKNALPEAMTCVFKESATIQTDIEDAVKWADVVVIGPGIGQGEDAYLKMKAVLEKFPQDKKLLIDADGINLIGKNNELRKLTCEVNNLIYTPHMAELSRLTGYSIAELKDDLDKIMSEVCCEDNAIYVCKDSVTRIYSKDKPIYINKYGNSGMATAGSGDVLAGVLAALTARFGMDLYVGVALGVYLHSLAGDEAASLRGQNAMLAGDIIDALPKVLKKMEEFSECLNMKEFTHKSI